jgi:hypothetical protein
MHVDVWLNDELFKEVNQLAAWVLELEARGVRVLALRLPARCRYFWPDLPRNMQALFMDRPVTFREAD